MIEEREIKYRKAAARLEPNGKQINPSQFFINGGASISNSYNLIVDA